MHIPKRTLIAPGYIDPAMLFTRATSGAHWNPNRALVFAPANTPRFDHDPVTGESLGVLIEPPSSSLLIHTAQLDRAAWGKYGATLTADAAIAPDGVMTADHLAELTSSSAHQVYRGGLIFVAGTNYVFSVFSKAAARRRISLQLTAAAFGAAKLAYFDLATGEAISGGSIQDCGNGWYRCWIASMATATVSSNAYIELNNATGGRSYTGDGESGVFLWGAGLETGSEPTSYIKAEASTVTRAPDVVTLEGQGFSEIWNPDEGTILVEFDCPAEGGRVLSINNGTASSRIDLLVTPARQPQIIVLDAGTPQVALTGAALVSAECVKMAAAIAAGDFALSVNGASVIIDNSGSMPPLDRLHVGSSLVGAYLGGHVRRLLYFPRRLTNAELQALST